MKGSTAHADSLELGASRAGRTSRERVAQQLGSIVFYALLVLLVLAAVPYGTVEPWWQALFECAVFGLAALWMIEGYLNGAWNLKTYKLLWPLAALAVFALVQTIPLGGVSDVPLAIGGGVWTAISADPHGTRRWAAKLLVLVLVGAMLLRYARDEQRLRTLAYVVIGVAMASAVFGLLRQMTQQGIGFGLPHLKPGFGYGQFINKNHFPFLMEMALGLVLGLALNDGARRERLVLYVGAGFLLGGALVSANSRGGVLSLLCQILFAALMLSTMRRARDAPPLNNTVLGRVRRFGGTLPARIALIVSLLAVAGVGIVWVGGDTLVGSMEALSTEVGAPPEDIRWSVRRRDIWPATWQLIKEHPIAGSGFGGYWMAITKHHQASGEKTPQEAHNDYLELLAGGGLIGLILGAWFIFILIKRVRRQLRSSSACRRALARGAAVGLAGVAIHSLFDFGLHLTINAVVCVVLVVVATADVRAAPHDMTDKH